MVNTREWRQGLRAEMKALRSALSSEQVGTASAAIGARLAQLAPIARAQNVMTFAGIEHEVDLAVFMSRQMEAGKSIFLPRVEPDGSLEAVRFTGWGDTMPGVFGIREPQGDRVDPARLDAVIVPGLVFDGYGHRLGYGKGYYDRFLRQLPRRVFICGVCYDFQVVDTVYPHSGDVAVHWIVTEKSEVAVNWDFF